MNSITMRAYAKINLGLDVLRKREDGYHEVCMIMQSINLYDLLTIRKHIDSNIKVRTNLSYLPNDQRNLVYKATALFRETFGITEGIRINLEKHIPVAAGLAGGSSDAAATLKGLNLLFRTGLSDTELKELGVKLGADVPYCIMLGTALSEGIGEVLTPLSPMPNCHILLAKPDISVSTRYVYESLSINPDTIHPDIPAMVDAIKNGSLSDLACKMDNILQMVTVKDYPIIERIKQEMNQHGALASLMSGSGPTVFGIYEDYKTAHNAYQHLKHSRYGRTTFLTKPYWP